MRLLALALIALTVFVPLVADAQTRGFDNPLQGGAQDVGDVLYNMIRWFIGIAGLLALLALIWGGTLYIISFNSPQYLDNAKGIIKWAIIGFAIIILAFVIIQTIAQFTGIGTTAPAP